MREQLNEQQRLQQFREIETRLQDIVPKITEINSICREIGRDTVKYVPAIINEVRPDGTKISKVIVKVYPDINDEKEFGQIPCDIFTDNIYFDVKELYEEAEEKNFDATFL